MLQIMKVECLAPNSHVNIHTKAKRVRKQIKKTIKLEPCKIKGILPSYQLARVAKFLCSNVREYSALFCFLEQYYSISVVYILLTMSDPFAHINRESYPR